MLKKFDLLAIGDIVTDAFIKLQDAEVNCDINQANCQICLRFGDKIPYQSLEIVRGVGNSPNAAVSATRLGLSTTLLTNLGGDDEGKKTLDTLKSENIDTSLVTVNNTKQTNYHFVLSYGAERTILIKHENFDYLLPESLLEASWWYLSSLGENSLAFHQAIADYLQAHPEIKLAFQPGTFQIKLGAKGLPTIFARTEIFVCNKEEAQKILETDESDIKKLLHGVATLGPKIIAITDGPNGAYTFDGVDILRMPIYPDPKPPVDRTGAGDAFASTLVSFIAQGLSIEEALRRAPINSMSVVQYIGAQAGLLTKEQIEQYLIDAPASYKVEKI